MVKVVPHFTKREAKKAHIILAFKKAEQSFFTT